MPSIHFKIFVSTLRADGRSSQAAAGRTKGGTAVAIEAAAGLTIKSATVEVTASGMGKFHGGGMLELKGGPVRLNQAAQAARAPAWGDRLANS
jgi:hypothetical protein